MFIGAIRLGSSSPIKVNLAIIAKNQQILVRQLAEGKVDFPFYFKIQAEKPETELDQFLDEKDLGNVPRQILYLSHAKKEKPPSQNAFELIVIIHLKTQQKSEWYDCRFESIEKLLKEKETTDQLYAFLDWFRNFITKHR